MATAKTTAIQSNIIDYINGLSIDQQKKEDSLFLIRYMETLSGHKATMWGSSIIGFGSYHYVYESGHSGDAPLLGFSPRKAAISLYVFTGLEEHAHLLDGLGTYKMGKACIYIKKVSDINLDILETIIKATMKYLKKKYKTL